MSTASRDMGLMTPPVVKTIQQRSLLVGLVFGVIALVGAWQQPEQFFRAYLLGFLACLGVTLGSMAILMLRHLTKGAWGMVIRRILGAAMRCVPLMAALFILPLDGLALLLTRLVPERLKPIDASTPLYLDESAMGTPSMALVLALTPRTSPPPIIRAIST